ncbi:beta-galactosidase trimerization domain-containing protein [Paenibacillus sp. FJAT-27812]|uniref:beta-galactosidase trimerization domain-containing protein n=1 Tax=Paenibacillus sp. FJAT-27812 TaxID=1684143 RepID=UPI0006A7DC63|nr:beta-galactosidase trimerization domain-containing protein [Paenibacillus sp. FJAT-27812]
MNFRQVHLDFHTSEAIDGIGNAFSKRQFQDMLKTGHVDSITVFSKCHHGWAYHPSDVNEMHPHLSFDLLGAQIEAAHEIGVKTPVYLSAGLDEKIARRHPNWLIRTKQEATDWTDDFLTPGYHQFCMNTPYVDVLADQVREVVERYDADGIFLDIVGVRECYCQYCIASIRERGFDPRNQEAMMQMWEETYFNYATKMNEAVHAVKPGLPVFHNSSHVARGRRDLVHLNTHLELESLPTGGWGYDHFPLSARYAQTLGVDYLGMTGKFHTSWGEFGGYKHPNALRYEAALSLANGARCSIGDQLHPSGFMDPATYALIGEAYREVEAKEEWCKGATAVADIALLSVEAASAEVGGSPINDQNKHADTGAVRILLEGHYLFDVIDTQADLSGYKVVILPDDILMTEQIKSKLAAFLALGGKVLATGRSGLSPDGTKFELNLGVQWLGIAATKPSYFKPSFELPSLQNASYVVYAEGQEVALTQDGESLGSRENAYFNRDIFTFCSHQHTPSDQQGAGPGMAEGPDGIYVAWNMFEDYAVKGSLPVKEIIVYALDRLLASKRLRTNLPAQGVTTLQAQTASNRWIHHLLYASPVRRGQNVEVIEDLLPLLDTEVAVAVSEPVREVYLAPQKSPLPFTQENGVVRYTIPKWSCHQMVVMQF